jgi:hypothetical protein
MPLRSPEASGSRGVRCHTRRACRTNSGDNAIAAGRLAVTLTVPITNQ